MAMNDPRPRDLPPEQQRCWVVTDGKIGMETQCVGLAEAMGLRPEVKRLTTRAPWRWLIPALWPPGFGAVDPRGDVLTPPWPDLLIATGRQSVVPALAVKRAGAGRTVLVQIQRPGFAAARVDVVVTPAHDRLAGANVIETLGSLHRISAARLAAEGETFRPGLAHLPRPLVTVLLGGPNKVYRWTDVVLRRLGDDLARLCADQGCGLAVSASRRTGDDAFARLRARLDGLPAVFWSEGDGPNPYFGWLALADAVVVTADSVNMVSEACSTGKPVFVVALDGGSAKFRRFHDALADSGVTRPFAGRFDRWTYIPLDETTRVAGEIARRLAAHRVSIGAAAASDG
jgi:mitochondrial fission protein ELM1